MSQDFPIEPNDRYAISTATALQLDFAIPFPFQRAADIVAVKEVDGVAELMTIGDDYTIVGENEPTGGTLTLTWEPEGGEIITRYGSAELARVMNTTLAGKFSSRQIELDFDRLTIIAQELARDLRRAYKAPLGSLAGDVVPGAEGEILIWGPDGSLIGGPAYDDIRGKSAYEIAVEQGFVGNEAAWLASLESVVPGPPGPGGNVQSVQVADGIAVDADPANPTISTRQKNSIEVDGGELQLIGDLSSPGNDKVYGTDGAGVKGWKNDPSGGSSGLAPIIAFWS